ncbi:MAG TPA: PAC2 family protein [Streptosporangiaceae bacterium]|nr:PAC2 family protein [Streptosporangiaceae bacterium]
MIIVRDAGDLYEVGPGAPTLEGAVLLHYLDGFIDAGAAGRLLTAHLLGSLEHEAVVTFDVDRLIDYRSRRPPMTFEKDRWAEYEDPEIAIHLVKDQAGTPFLLLTGPEPDHEWERFISAVSTVSSRLGAELVIRFHGIPMGVPHTRPLGVTAHGTKPELVAGSRPIVDRLQVPGSAASLLEFRLGGQGKAAVGFAVHVPHYLAQAAYPAAAVALLDYVCKVSGLSLPTETLREAAQRTDEEIARQVESSEEITELVQALERQYDAVVEAAEHPDLLAEQLSNMPTAEELGAQFERFLAEQQGHPDPPEN